MLKETQKNVCLFIVQILCMRQNVIDLQEKFQRDNFRMKDELAKTLRYCDFFFIKKIPETASLCKMFSKWGFLKLQASADFFHQRFQLGIIESHELRKTGSQFGFWNPNLPAKECPHPIQPNLKDIPRKMFHKNVSFYFGLPILMFFSSSIAKLAIILDNLYWNLISALNYLPKIEKAILK